MTDKDALINIKTRLVGDVGYLIHLVEKRNEEGEAKHIPFWALLRTMFPIAEALAGLLYGDSNGNTQNYLKRLFDEELVAYNPNYKRCSAILTLMYRHGLIHTDLPRPITNVDGTITCTWGVGFGGNVHLNIHKGVPYTRITDGVAGMGISIPFEVKQFYADLVQLCEDLAQRNFNGLLAENYESWKTFVINPNKPFQLLAEKEMAQLGEDLF